MTAYTVAAIIAGLAMGAITAALWNMLRARLGDSQFWSALNDFTKSTIAGDKDAHFFRDYGQLLKQLGRYVAGNLVVVLLAFLPVTLFLAFAGPGFGRDWNRGADRIVIHPRQNVTVTLAGQLWKLDLHRGSFPTHQDFRLPMQISVGESTFHCPSAHQNWAFSSSPVKRFLLRVMGFETMNVEGQPPLLIVRPWRGGDDNPFQPYLNQMELLFLASFSLASIGGMLIPRAMQRWRSSRQIT